MKSLSEIENEVSIHLLWQIPIIFYDPVLPRVMRLLPKWTAVVMTCNIFTIF